MDRERTGRGIDEQANNTKRDPGRGMTKQTWEASENERKERERLSSLTSETAGN